MAKKKEETVEEPMNPSSEPYLATPAEAAALPAQPSKGSITVKYRDHKGEPTECVSSLEQTHK